MQAAAQNDAAAHRTTRAIPRFEQRMLALEENETLRPLVAAFRHSLPDIESLPPRQRAVARRWNCHTLAEESAFMAQALLDFERGCVRHCHRPSACGGAGVFALIAGGSGQRNLMTESASRRLSLCMIVRDEAQLLPGCLESVRGAVDEIVAVDTGSSDATPEIVRAHGGLLLRHAWREDFSAARNVSLDAATGDWILWMDADERLRPEEHGASAAAGRGERL